MDYNLSAELQVSLPDEAYLYDLGSFYGLTLKGAATTLIRSRAWSISVTHEANGMIWR